MHIRIKEDGWIYIHEAHGSFVSEAMAEIGLPMVSKYPYIQTPICFFVEVMGICGGIIITHSDIYDDTISIETDEEVPMYPFCIKKRLS